MPGRFFAEARGCVALECDILSAACQPCDILARRSRRPADHFRLEDVGRTRRRRAGCGFGDPASPLRRDGAKSLARTRRRREEGTMSSHVVFNGVDDATKKRLEAYWDQKLPRVKKLLTPYREDLREIDLTVYRHPQNGHRSRYEARAVVHLPTGTLAAHADELTPDAAVDRVADTLVTEIRKHKEQVRKDCVFKRKRRERADLRSRAAPATGQGRRPARGLRPPAPATAPLPSRPRQAGATSAGTERPPTPWGGHRGRRAGRGRRPSLAAVRGPAAAPVAGPVAHGPAARSLGGVDQGGAAAARSHFRNGPTKSNRTVPTGRKSRNGGQNCRGRRRRRRWKTWSGRTRRAPGTNWRSKSRRAESCPYSATSRRPGDRPSCCMPWRTTAPPTSLLQNRPESEVKADIEEARGTLRQRLLAGEHVPETQHPVAAAAARDSAGRRDRTRHRSPGPRTRLPAARADPAAGQGSRCWSGHGRPVERCSRGFG